MAECPKCKRTILWNSCHELFELRKDGNPEETTITTLKGEETAYDLEITQCACGFIISACDDEGETNFIAVPLASIDWFDPGNLV